MSTQQQLTLPLQAYLPLVPSLTGPKSTSNFISQIINNPHTYVFGEILNGVQKVRELDDDDDNKRILKLFSYGDYQQYKDNKDKYKLTEQNILKLKKLSIVSMAQTKKILPYNELMEKLDIDNVRALEDILIDTTYTGLLKGKLDQKLKCFQVHEFVGRDVEDSELDDMISVLGDWSAHCKGILNKIADLSKYSQDAFKEHEQKRLAFNKKVRENEENIKSVIDSIRDDDTQVPLQQGGRPSMPRQRAAGRR